MSIKTALTATLQNGLPLNRQALESACKKYLSLEPSESNRSLARMFGLDEKTVRNYRKDLEFEAAIVDWQLGETRVLLDGGAEADRFFTWGLLKGVFMGLITVGQSR